ncbi:hypothetical protein [Rhizobium sp. LCM 4573]|uniref:hypothetical protein n=1 Tax=Rhizobium sp. LCM 4573 TaxID=1848291 RepID=UPI0008DA889D|nr:hypothetical protein [Rhizobium sp. LCM 4573]OHV81602.1 hypothetical protein LCM4573_21190 [Rhizobium sp. LCM 4573]
MNISLEVQLQEEAALAAMLRNRSLVLAQKLAEVTSERDQFKKELETMRKALASKSSKGRAKPQEVNDGAAE